MSDPVKAMTWQGSGALGQQIGGDHYKSLPIQPVEYIHANHIGFMEGSVIKYVSRHKQKNGAQDLKKAMHFIALLLQLEYKVEVKIVDHEEPKGGDGRG